MLKVINEEEAIIDISRTDAILSCQDIQGKDSCTCNFYVGDKESQQERVFSFLAKHTKMYVDVIATNKFTYELSQILRYYGYLFKGKGLDLNEKIDFFRKQKSYVEIPCLESTQKGELHRYCAFPDKKNPVVIAFRGILYALIVEVQIVSMNDRFLLRPRLKKKWREKMSNYELSQSQCEEIIDQFKHDFREKTEKQIALLFGIKYSHILLNSNIDLEELITKSSFQEKGIALDSLKEGIAISKDVLWEINPWNKEDSSEEKSDGAIVKSGKNKILFGVPGCGKSYYIEHEILAKENYLKENIIRTTFYQDYSNTDFVGQILPKVTKDETGKDIVEYVFNPGPFTLALIQAFKNPEQKVALVVEEINRGNAPAIFGDIFQLLDRDDNGESEYGIVNVGIMDYLKSQEIDVGGDIRLPGNLSIFATMNTSDQNVFTLDTAFTRRWKKERIPNVFKDGIKIAGMFVPGMQNVTWKEFVEKINSYIKFKIEDLQVNEDKQLGVFFVKEDSLVEESGTETESQKRSFANKVLEYLWEDVSKFDHQIIFRSDYKTFEDLSEAYVSGKPVFNEQIGFPLTDNQN